MGARHTLTRGVGGWRAALMLAAFVGLLGCTHDRRKSEPNGLASAWAPLPEPPRLVAELTLAHPEASFRTLRELGSPLSGLLPSGFALLAATLLDLPPLSADSFDSELPAVGVLVRDSKGELGWVMALHVVSGPELTAKLSTGDHAPFRASAGEPKGLILLQPLPGAPPSALTLGVFDNYLVVSHSSELLASAGPFTARTLPRRAAADAAFSLKVSQHALSTEVVPAVRAAWAGYRTLLSTQDHSQRAAHGGRAPDFGDPAQVILALDAEAEAVLSVLDSATELRVTLDAWPDRLVATAELRPAAAAPSGGLLPELGAGAEQAILSLPSKTLLAVSVARPPGPATDAPDADPDLTWLPGGQFGEHDSQLLREVLRDWQLGRGAHTQYGYLGGADPGVFLVSDVADSDRLRRAGHGFFKLPSLAGIRAPLSAFVGEPHVSESVTHDADLGAPLERATVTFRKATGSGSAASAPPAPLVFAWQVEQEIAFAAAGKRPEPVLSHLVRAHRGAEARLEANPELLDGIRRAAVRAALLAYIDTRILNRDGSSAAPEVTAPLFLSAGDREKCHFLRLEISKRALDLALPHALGR